MSSSRRTDDRRDELGVRARDWSAISGAAMARFDVALRELSAQRSGDGESARNRDPGDDAADKGRGMGLNSWAFALRSLGEDNGEAGRLAVN